MSIITLKLTGEKVVSSDNAYVVNYKIFYYSVQFYRQKLIYDILEPWRYQPSEASKEFVNMKQNQSEVYLPDEFLLTMGECEPVITQMLDAAQKKLGRLVWLPDSERVLTITTKPVVKLSEFSDNHDSSLIYRADGELDLLATPIEAIERYSPAMVQMAMDTKELAAKELIEYNQRMLGSNVPTPTPASTQKAKRGGKNKKTIQSDAF